MMPPATTCLAASSSSSFGSHQLRRRTLQPHDVSLRRRSAVTLAGAVMIILSMIVADGYCSSITTAHAFTPSTITTTKVRGGSSSSSGTALLVSRSSSSSSTTETEASSTWSRASASRSSSSSRFGVRRRVRAVLEKAKNRTGISNRNSCDASVVAETASMGGLSGYDDSSADLVVRGTGNDLESNGYFPYANGNSNGYDVGSNADTSTVAPKGNGVKNGASKPKKKNGAVSPADAIDRALEQVQGKAPLRNGTDTDLVLETSDQNEASSKSERHLEVDAMLNSGEIEPLPFKLPQLTPLQLQQLHSGERIQEQSKMGREGSGYVVVDVEAPDYIVWEGLLDFERYPEYIGTVRSMTMFTNTHLKQSYIAEKPVLPGTNRETRHYGNPSVTRARFVLSKFKFNIAAIHKYRPHPHGHYMEFSLDKANKNVVLKEAKGIWYTQAEPEGRKGVTRVWLLCELKVSSMLPKFIVDYAAKRAMPRASTWVVPTVEQLKKDFQLMGETDVY